MKKFICILLACSLTILACTEVYAANFTDTEALSAHTPGKPVPTPDDGQERPPENYIKKKLQVLIVGNSFSRNKPENITYSVEKPLKELARSNGHKLHVTTLAHGGAQLRNYAGMTDSHRSYYREFKRLLKNKKWDFIILQEYSIGTIEYFESSTYPAVQKLLKLINKHQPQAAPLLYMTHGFQNGSYTKVNGIPKILTIDEMELYIAAAYKTLEQKLGVEMVPVGMHANRADKLYPQIKMRSNDLKHPAYAGYYLAACCFYYRIYGTKPIPFKRALSNCPLNQRQLNSLASLAADSLSMNKEELLLSKNEVATLQAVPGSSNITYKSLNTNVADVTPRSGTVIAKKEGYTVIAAETPDGLQAFCCVTVAAPLSFTHPYYLAEKGSKIQMLPQTDTTNLSWTSNDKRIAAVHPSTGLVTAKSPGKAKITVTNNTSAEKASYILYVSCSAPRNLEAESLDSKKTNARFGRIKLSWDSVPGAKGYTIYRADRQSQTYQKIGTSTNPSYVDKCAATNKMYYYKVAAKNSLKLCTSSLSHQVKGIILRAPALEAQWTQNSSILLTWKKRKKADGYVLYRSLKKNSGYEEIAELYSGSKLRYIDKDVKKNKTYYYQIRAFKELRDNTFYGQKSKKIKICLSE